MTAFRLSAAARAAGQRLAAYDSLGSTNTEALERARAGESGPLWIAARRQSAGRGRRGSLWSSPEGNLAATLLWPIAGIAPDRVPTLGFVAGLALVEALDDVAAAKDESSAPRFALKWPNDVLAGGAKLAGLLLEAEGRRAVAIGYGVNVLAAPGGLPYPATSLAGIGIATDAAALLEALSERFLAASRLWDEGRGFAQVRRAWMDRAGGLDGPVSVVSTAGRLGGLCNGIDEEGRLLILAPDGTTHTVTAGEVHFGEAATAA